MNKNNNIYKLIIRILYLPGFILTLLIFFPNEIFASSSNQLDIPIVGIESGIEDQYFYLAENSNNSWVTNKLMEISIDNADEHNHYLITKNNIHTIECTIFTSWDEEVATLLVSADKDFYINGEHYIPIKSNLDIFEINCSAESFSAMVNDIDKNTICDITISSSDFDNISGTLKGRGSSSWEGYNKKSFTLAFDKKTKISSLGSCEKWNLLANAEDRSLLKNSTWFDFADSLELPYTPKYKNINLFINGIYKGIYTITSKVKKDKQLFPLTDGDYLFCIGATNPKQKIEINSVLYFGENDDNEISNYVEVEYPKNLSDTQYKNAEKIVNNFIQAIEQEDDELIKSTIDLESFAKLYWIEEISMNFDSLSRSIYFYYSAYDNKIHAGPIWDMDLTMGFCGEIEGIDFSTPTGWKIRELGWWKSLCQHKIFMETVNSVYREYDLPNLIEQSVVNYDIKIEDMSTEGKLNYLINSNEIIHNDLFIDSLSYLDYANKNLDFYKTRAEWINSEMEDIEIDISRFDTDIILYILITIIAICLLFLIRKITIYKTRY